MELQVGVKILLKNEEEKYLLMRRNATKYPEMAVRWDIPGGRIDTGTTLLENLAREVKEETGLLFNCEPTLIGAQDILRVSGRHVVRLTYIGNCIGEPKLSDEHDDYGWFSLEEIKNNDAVDEYLGQLIQNGAVG